MYLNQAYEYENRAINFCAIIRCNLKSFQSRTIIFIYSYLAAIK